MSVPVYTPKKELLSCHLSRHGVLPGGKVFYSFCLVVEVSNSEEPDQKDFIDTFWKEIKGLPTSAAIHGMGVHEITEWPLEEELDMMDIPSAHKKIFDRMGPNIGKSGTRLYHITIGVVADEEIVIEELMKSNDQIE